jgi:hypothetical protein
MYIQIGADGNITLEDIDNMRAFSIVEKQAGTAHDSLSDLGEVAEDNHYWLDANAVINLSGRSDDVDWVKQFWDMLSKAEPYGYSDVAGQRVKAHIEQS